MEIQEIVCLNCGAIDVPKTEERIFINGSKHTEAKCPSCDAFIKFLPSGRPIDPSTVMPFGKHKGKIIADIAKEDAGYASWAGENLKGKWKKVFEELNTAQDSSRR